MYVYPPVIRVSISQAVRRHTGKSREASELRDLTMIVSFWNWTGASAALLPKWLSVFTVIEESRPESCDFESSQELAVSRPSA